MLEVFLAVGRRWAPMPPASPPASRNASPPSSPASSWAAAQLAARAGRRDEAYRLALASIAAGKGQSVLEAAKAAMIAATSGNPDAEGLDGARDVLDAARRREPKDAELLVMAGVLRHLQGRYDDEADLYRAALGLQPSNLIARNNLAWVVAEDQGRPADGLAMIVDLIRDEGPDADRLGTRGVILLRLGRLDAAVADLEQAAKLRPSALHSYYLALAYKKAGRADDARAAIGTAAREGLSASDVDEPGRAECRALLAEVTPSP